PSTSGACSWESPSPPPSRAPRSPPSRAPPRSCCAMPRRSRCASPAPGERSPRSEPAPGRGTMAPMSTRPAPALDPSADIVDLTAAIVDIESVSGNEQALADAVEQALRTHAPHLHVLRDGDTVIARTQRGLAERVLLAGHLDTVPLAGNLPSRRRIREGREELAGRGTCDMKGGVAVFLKLAVEATAAPVDLTWIFYDHEEVA